ncbi:MAG: malto-oligosyltrehalose trehalohydrolase [Desulfobacterales bacterium]|nr:malto-oligosyltrehalose trehalohydrolase [Desulfobacterales bacterium]
MAQIHIWAPEAEALTLDCGDRRVNMAKSAAGWWTLDAPFIDHGVDYAFRVDGDGPFPDPRSAWQPQGVHGPSRWVDHARFTWSDAGWQPPPLGSAVIYELHVGTFTPKGTFQSAIERLGELIDLGVTHVELMPVAEFSGNRGWGYDGVDLYAPHHAYGGPEGLKRLVDACHRRGLAVLLDVVYNHLGPAGNYLGRFGPYFTDRYATPWGQAVNFDGPFSDEVRRFFADNARMWLRDYHMDGLRIDAVHAIVDTSAIHFLEHLAAVVKDLETELGRHFVLIAESDLNDPRIVSPSEVGGYGLDAQWNEDFHHSLHAVLTGENDGYYRDFGKLADLAKALSNGLVYDGRYSAHRRRHHGRSAAGLSGHRFVGCLQNHDQVGNRAVGHRTSHLVSQDRLKIGAALVLTAPFVPMLFQGEEWAASTPFLYFTDHQDPELGAAVKAGRQAEFVDFGWKPDQIPDPQEEETFLRSKLDWDELGRAPHDAMYEWHRALIGLRRRFPALRDGRMERTTVDLDEEARWLVMRRGEVSVACNLAEASQWIPCRGTADQTILLATHSAVALENDKIFLPPESLTILKDSKNQG